MFSFFFFSSRRRHTRCSRDWSSDVCSSDLPPLLAAATVLLAACHGGRGAADEAQAPAGAQAVVGAGTAVATTQPFPQIVRAIGTVGPRPGPVAELAPPGPTRGARIWV